MQKGSGTRTRNGGYLSHQSATARMAHEEWCHLVQAAARRQMAGQNPWQNGIRIMVEFALPVPKAIGKANVGWFPHRKRPDIDKLTRSLLDALTGIVYVDDSQVCMLAVNKVYAWESSPGANVTCNPISDDEAQRMAKYTAALRKVVSDAT